MITGALARGVVVLADSARKLQSLQMRLTADEVKDDMEHLEPYGFTSSPLPGAEGLAGFIGDRSHGVVIVVADRRYRLAGLQGGEVAIYTDEGDKIHLKRGRVIDIETGTLNVRAQDSVNFETPLITATGRIESTGDQIAGGISQINHVHTTVKSGNEQSGAPAGGGD
ncbi:phage baseplate assembly protein V [Pseudomonas cremoricolorata]|uniref:Phage assembly protein n=1 Tax=Pseudomonas cremoricolorata TaxID=157783 RepID=A0A089WMS1_9PSED|nr:phage baseplate assembly protein V [Pseudomonas cremoricolorata]AIR90590.1 phage assembly protein [Pseudomonas cremoricolorata]